MKLYKTLNCTSTSTFNEIDKHYKRLIKEVHPQRNKLEEQRYYDIKSAYEILKDSYKRDFYDLYEDQVIPMLQNSQEGFAVSRVFFKNNLLAFILLSLICVSSLLFLPLYIYLYKDTPNVSYSLYIIPFFLATFSFIFPIRKSYKLIGKMILQLYKMVIASINGVIIGTELVIICLYTDRIVDGLVGSIAVLLLELVSICFSFYSRRKLIELDGTQVDYKVRISGLFKKPLATFKIFMRQMVWSSSLLIVFFNCIPMYIKASAAFSGVYFYLISLEAPFIAKIIICSPLLLYSTTFYLAVTGFKSCFIFFPLMLLTIAIIGGVCVAYSYLPKIKMKYRELPFEELV